MPREALVLLTGVACDAELWRAQQAALAKLADCSVIEPQGPTIEDMADDVLARTPGRFALGGLSMGGYVALAIMRRAPERVARLCLVNTSARADGDVQAASRRALIAEVKAGGFQTVLDRLLPLLTHARRHADAALQAGIMAMMRRTGAPAFLLQQIACGARPDTRRALPEIGIPTCVIAGAEDRVAPAAHGREIAAAIPHASLHVLDVCAHLAPMEQPGQVTSIMGDWLARGAASCAAHGTHF